MNIEVRYEQARGCGYRKAGKGGVGIYLVGPEQAAPCGRLPFALTVCPTCSGGIKPSRSWTWITPQALFWAKHATMCEASDPRTEGFRRVLGQLCQSCPLGGACPFGQHGLLWVGEKFYDTPAAFMDEARRMGISRKLGAIPHGFELGKTCVYLAHRKAVGPDRLGGYEPGVFTAFYPRTVELVVDSEQHVPDKAKRLAERIGEDARIIKVVPAQAEQEAS